MSEETKTELKLPKSYKRPSEAEYAKANYSMPYEEFFTRHEAELAAQYASGEVTDEMFDEDMRLSKLDEMADADNDGLPDVLHVKSQVRAVGNRTLRARHPTRHRFKQYLFGNPSLRLVRKRVLRLSAAQVRAGIDELIDKEAAGILSVHAPNGARIDLAALKDGQVVMAQLPAPAPLPNKPLDSAANDVPAGENMPQHLGGTFPGDPIAQQTAARLSAEKQEAAEKKEPPPAALGSGVDPLDPAGAPMAPEGTPPTSVSTELEQPPLGVDGNTAPVQDQLPKDSEASVEAPPAVEEAATPALTTTEVIQPPAAEAEPEVKEEPAKTESSSSHKGGGKKGGRK